MTTYKPVYIAGPMRGIPEWNHSMFFEAQEHLLDLGYDPSDIFNPAKHDTDQGIEAPADGGAEGFDLRTALAADLAWIAAKAEVILLLPGWENSSGVAAELALAKALHLGAVLYNPDDPDNSTVYEDCNSVYQPPRKTSSFVTTSRITELSDMMQSGLTPDSHLTGGEVRIVDPVTGGEKGSKPERFDLIPVGALREIARVYGFGANKYSKFGACTCGAVTAERNRRVNGVGSASGVTTASGSPLTPGMAETALNDRTQPGSGRGTTGSQKPSMTAFSRNPAGSVDLSPDTWTMTTPVAGPDAGSASGVDYVTDATLDSVTWKDGKRITALQHKSGCASLVPLPDQTGDNNWRKGYAWHLSYAAGMRHFTSFWDGEDLDPESQLPHLAHAAWQAITLLQFYLDGLGTDDRFKS